LNSVDLPTFGRPTMATFRAMEFGQFLIERRGLARLGEPPNTDHPGESRDPSRLTRFTAKNAKNAKMPCDR
jgi:hypothetical protein